jgi:hypothetical protein
MVDSGHIFRLIGKFCAAYTAYYVNTFKKFHSNSDDTNNFRQNHTRGSVRGIRY